MYSTLAWPPDATLRAIWRAIVVLPVPWAPPMSSSSPARRPRADRLVERGEPERDRLVLGDVAGGDLVVEVDQHVERRPGRHAAVRGVEAPGWRAWPAARRRQAFQVRQWPRYGSSPDGCVAVALAPGRPANHPPGPYQIRTADR